MASARKQPIGASVPPDVDPDAPALSTDLDAALHHLMAKMVRRPGRGTA